MDVAEYRRRQLNIVLMLILAGMLIALLVQQKPIVADYLDWQWRKSDNIAGYLKKLALDNGTDTIFGKFIPAFGYAEQHYVAAGDREDPSYEKYLDADLNDEADTKSQNQEPESAVEEATQAESVAVVSNDALPVTSAVQYSRQELLDFDTLLKNNYTVTSITELRPEAFDVEAALDIDMTIQQDNSQPQILIFHTHSQEGFADSVEGDSSTMITGVGEYLAQLLRQKYGYQVIHDTSVYDLIDGKLDRSKAYTYAEKGVEKILAQYPSIEVIIDLHRDGVDESNHLVTQVNGKSTAKIMFFNGISYTKVNGNLDYLPNPYIEENLAMSLQMKLLGDTYYPGFLRKNYINGYRYCLHYRGKSMLIEAGAQNNTLQEELNAMEPLADILHRLLAGEKAYK